MIKMNEKAKTIAFKILRILLIVILSIVVILAGMIAFLSITEYRPKDRESLEVTGGGTKNAVIGEEISVLTFNIGYGALGDNADFFMDGGKSVNTADKARVEQNLSGILGSVKSLDPDIVFFQEIDKSSTRSHKINEYEKFKNELGGYSFSFANNFKVAFLPYPIPPIGKVDSGIATASRFGVESAERVQLPIPFSWPVRMANLKRCVIISRIPIENSDKELVLFNLHLEAYDSGEGKEKQTKMLADLLKAETDKGNYVIAGGDFNQIFSTADKNAYPAKDGMWKPGEIDVSAFGEGFNFLMDSGTPTCRSLDKAYKGADRSDFQYYLIDGFIVSDNIEVNLVKTQDLDFVCSDHNPVLMKLVLKGNNDEN
ncbi:MAG: endonuclease [Clostridia bacterium]|nr:endonuclease [Clostridia bacterium]